MGSSRLIIGVAGLVGLAGLALATPNAHAAGTHAAALAAPALVLDLELNEPVGAAVAADSSGFAHHGTIGNHIKMNGEFADWDRHPAAEGIYYGAAHLIVVNDTADGSLDPGTDNFTVEFRYRTKDKFGNVLQKGQSKTAGGQIKFQQPGGFLSCMFKSPTGRAATKSKVATNDNQWHIARCERTPSQVSLYIDDVLQGRIKHATGNINNSVAWTFGGKLNCDVSNPDTGADSCDLYPGDIDWVRFTKG